MNEDTNMDANPFLAQPDPPSYYELRSERDELAVENAHLAQQLERMEDQLKTYKHRGDMLQGALMVLRDASKQAADVYETVPPWPTLSCEFEVLSVRIAGANATLFAYGEDPF